MGRFDWSYDGKSPPKLLEYNADTPSLLLESSAVSKDWFNDRFGPNAKGNSRSLQDQQKTQSNYLMAALEDTLSRIKDECDELYRYRRYDNYNYDIVD